MPDYFCHNIIADKIYERLDKKHKTQICDHSLFLLGAQGGDVFFTYNLKPTKSNLGRRLHLTSPYEIFNAIKDGDRSYLAGFATHYALDRTLHPIIYAFEGTKRSPLAHNHFESDVGLYVSRLYATPRKILPKEKVLRSTFSIYDTIKKFENQVTVTGVERCLKRHFLYTKFLYRTKRQKYYYDYDHSSLHDAIEEGVTLGVSVVENVLDGNISRELFCKSFLER